MELTQKDPSKNVGHGGKDPGKNWQSFVMLVCAVQFCVLCFRFDDHPLDFLIRSDEFKEFLEAMGWSPLQMIDQLGALKNQDGFKEFSEAFGMVHCR